MHLGLACLGVMLAGTTPVAAAVHHVPAGGNIQQAINNAAAGDTVQLAAATYNLSAAILAKSDVAVVGAGSGQTVLKVSSGNVTTFFNLDGKSNVRLADMSLDGTGSSASYGVSSTSGGGSGHVIESLAISNLAGKSSVFGPIGVFFENGVTGAQIRNNTFHTIGVNSVWGSAVRLGHNANHHVVEGNSITGVGRGGILANNGSHHLVIRNNTITAIGVNNPTDASGVAPKLGIEIWQGSDDTVIEGNTVDHWISVDGSQRVAVRNNTIHRPDTKTTRAFTALELAGSQSHPVRDVILSGNVLVKSTNAASSELGLSVSGGGVVERALIQGNTLDSARTWGVQIQGENGATGIKRRLYFLNNTITGTLDGPHEDEAIRLNGDSGQVHDLVFIDNTLTGNHGPALTVLTPANVTDIRFTNNTATGNGAGGVALANIGNPDHPDAMIVHVSGGGDQPVQLQVSFVGGRVVQHALWDLGFGVPLVGDSITQALPHGTHTVTVVAWDSDGNADHATFEVNLPEPSAGLLLLGTLPLLGGRGRGVAKTRG